MIRTYLKERQSWIGLFVLLQLLVILVSYLDSSIPLGSVIYIVFLSVIIFIVFLIIRCNKETKYYKSLIEWENHLDLSTISDADSPFERLVEESLLKQTERLKQESALNMTQLTDEKDELLSWIHEVKTPLTTMQLMIDRINDETLKAQLNYEWLRIYLLLDQQLHQKRIHFIEHDLYIEKIHLKDLIVNEIKALQPWCMQKGIGFELQLERTEILCDGKWFSYIIRQFLTNAVKYSSSSDIIIRSYGLNDQTILEVQDFGRGIDQKDLPRIFDKGFTSTTKHQDNNATGMGLYLAKKAANPLQIQFAVKSNLGEGTTVTLTFPKRNELVSITGM